MALIGAAILAGGRAVRLGGRAKPFVEIGGRTIAQRQLEALRALFPRVFVVANDPAPWAPFSVEVVGDRLVGQGPLAGVEAALAHARECAAVVCVAGDMPFLSPPLLTALRDRPLDAPALAPRRNGRAEPTCARYAVALLPTVRARLGSGEIALHRLLESAGAAWIEDPELAGLDPDGSAFVNVNRPADEQRARELARARRP